MRNRFLLAVLVILAALPVNLAWGQANLPNNPNAATVQGPDPTGMLGYPLATVPATGALPWPVSILSFLSSVVADQGQPNAGGLLGWPVRMYAERNVAVPGPFLLSCDRLSQANGSTNSSNVALYTAANVFGQSDTSTSVLAVNAVPFSGTPLATDNALVTQGMMLMNRDATNTPRQVSGDTPAFSDGAAANAHVAVWTLAVQLREQSGGIMTLAREPDTFKVNSTAAAGNTALWAPGAGKKFRLMRWRYTVTGSAATAGGADVVIKLFDGAAGVTGQQDTVTVPAAATTLQGQLAASPWIDLGNGRLSSAANNVLNINLSAALTAGTVTVEAVGTEE